MKAIVIDRVEHFTYTDLPEPVLQSDEVLVKVAAGGLCGTDLHILKGEYPACYPLVPGHEFSGTVAGVGSAVRSIHVNDRVCVDPNIYCHRCAFCRDGRKNLCENLHPVGVKRDGGFAQYCAVPESQIFQLPESVGFSEGAMVEPVSCAVHGINLAEIKPGQTVLVWGGGAIGGILAQLARAAGAANVVVSEPLAERRKLLLKVAADVVIDPKSQDVVQAIRKIDPHGADVVFEAAGLPLTARQTFAVAKRGAAIVFFGVLAPDQRIEISPYELFANEWTLRGSFINPDTVQHALNIIASRRIDVKSFISHQFPLEEFGRALEKFGQSDSLKVQVIPN